MTVHHYNDAVIMLGGKPVATAESVTMSHEPDPTPIAATFSGRVDMDAVAEMFNVARLPPAQPRGHITIPYGILGPIRLDGTADPLSWENVATGGFRMAENELERAVSMAVQKAIMERAVRSGVHARAMSAGAELWRLSGVVLRKRGERKKRRAMRRLLRAAGILGEER